jgi:hypothetical protein
VVLAVAPETKLPDTSKSQKTDTDQLNAIEELLDNPRILTGFGPIVAMAGFVSRPSLALRA